MSGNNLKNAWNNLKNTVADFSSLEVVTLTGDVKTFLKSGDAGKQDETSKTKNPKLDWSSVLKAADPADKETTGVVKLALASKFEIDGDATLFVSDDVATENLVDAHNAAVKAGQDARNAIVEFLGSTLKSLVN